MEQSSIPLGGEKGRKIGKSVQNCAAQDGEGVTLGLLLLGRNLSYIKKLSRVDKMNQEQIWLALWCITINWNHLLIISF